MENEFEKFSKCENEGISANGFDIDETKGNYEYEAESAKEESIAEEENLRIGRQAETSGEIEGKDQNKRQDLTFLAEDLGHMIIMHLQQQDNLRTNEATTANSSIENIDCTIQQLFQEQNEIKERLNSMQSLIEEQSKTIEEQADVIKKQHQTITQYNSDIVYKTQKDLIMELIGIADQLKYTIEDHASGNDFESLYSAIKDLSDWVDGGLQGVAVRKYEAKEYEELDTRRQEIVEIRQTDNPLEDKMIKPELPGYIWSIPMVGSNNTQQSGEQPRTYEFLIRPEQVVRLRYTGATERLQDEELDSIGPAEHPTFENWD